MKVDDVTETLNLALEASGRRFHPPLLSKGLHTRFTSLSSNPHMAALGGRVAGMPESWQVRLFPWQSARGG